jgi:hypothetical protein
MCRGAAGDIYHLGNSHPVTAHDLTAWLTAGGYPLRSLPYKTWRDEMIRQAGFTRETALYSLGPLLALEVTEEVGWIGNVPRFDSQRTQQQLGSALACPPVDAATFHTYLRFFVETGFLPAPAASETVPASTPSMVER